MCCRVLFSVHAARASVSELRIRGGSRRKDSISQMPGVQRVSWQPMILWWQSPLEATYHTLVTSCYLQMPRVPSTQSRPRPPGAPRESRLCKLELWSSSNVVWEYGEFENWLKATFIDSILFLLPHSLSPLYDWMFFTAVGARASSQICHFYAWSRRYPQAGLKRQYFQTLIS